jgi:hypothetical protein
MKAGKEGGREGKERGKKEKKKITEYKKRTASKVVVWAGTFCFTA